MADRGWDVVSTERVGSDPWSVQSVTPIGEPPEQILTPEEMITPPPKVTGATEKQKADLRKKTEEFEKNISLGSRILNDLERGYLQALNIIPEASAAYRQKRINELREGKNAYFTDPLTGNQVPMVQEEIDAAIANLQRAQKAELEAPTARAAKAAGIPRRPVLEAVEKSKTFREALDLAGEDVLGAMAGASLESIPQMAPALALGAATRNPAAGAAALGGTSFAGELGGGVREYLADQGININDQKAVDKALNDPAIFNKAYEFALTRAQVIGGFDLATAGLASRTLVPKALVTSPGKREAANILVAQPISQIAGGAGGEAAAQLATYGEVQKPGAVLTEALGEGPTSLLETAAFGGQRAIEQLRGPVTPGAVRPPEAAPPAAGEPTPPVVPPTLPPTVPPEPPLVAPPTPEPPISPVTGVTPIDLEEEAPTTAIEPPAPAGQWEVQSQEPIEEPMPEVLAGAPMPKPEELEKAEADIARLEAEREVLTGPTPGRPNLYATLTGKLSIGDVNDISPDRTFNFLKNRRGRPLADVIWDGELDDFLPENLRSNIPDVDLQVAEEYIKEKLRNNNYLPFETEMRLRENELSLEDAEKTLEFYDVNKRLQEITREETALAEAQATAAERPEGVPGEPEAAPPAPAFELQGETREETLARQAEEEASREDLEARAIADREREAFTLTPTPPAELVTPPSGDLFGARGLLDQPARTFTPPTKATLFEEEEAGSAIKKLGEGVTRFASGMSSLSDLDVAMRTRAGYRRNGVGVDVGLLSKNALDILAQTVINLKTPVFIDSGAFSAFTKKLRGKESPALDFDKILEKYDSILEKIAEANPSEEQDYPRPMLVMPDIVGDQAGSVSLIENYKDWIRGEALGNLSQPIIPIQKGELSLSEVYEQIKKILGTDKFIVGVPSQEEAVSRQELADFLGTSKPPKIHFLGAASARKLNPLLAIVAEKSPETQVSADASKVRSAILSGVAQGKTREDAIIDALRQEEDPAELIEKYYAQSSAPEAQPEVQPEVTEEPTEAKPSKEEQAAINRARQAERREAAEGKPTKGDVLLIEADEPVFAEALEPSNPEDERLNELFNPKQKPAKPKPTKMVSPDEAKKIVNGWKQEAKKQGRSGENADKTVISLFDASGEWSKPWAEAGFNVVTYDLQSGQDIKDFDAATLLEEHGNDNIWAILAAPPCTDFASSGAQYWAKKDADGRTEESNELVRQVLRTVELLRPAVWAMENPVGRMAKLNELPPAQLTFQPNVYGDPYTKKTLLWGNFNNKLPQAPVEPTEGSKITEKISGGNKYARSLTPEGFAYAFFMANNPVGMTQEQRLSREFHGISPEEFKDAGTEKEILDAIQDNYYDGNLKAVRDALKMLREAERRAEAKPLPTEQAFKKAPAAPVVPDYDQALEESRQKEMAEEAEKLGGVVAWRSGDEAILDVPSMRTGETIYVYIKGQRRTNVDVRDYVGNFVPAPKKLELTKIINDYEAEQKRKYENAPFIEFKNGIAFSADIPKEMVGVIEGWRNLLGLRGNLYISTMEDVAKNREKYTGPHRNVRATLIRGKTAGTAGAFGEALKNDDQYITFRSSTSKTKMLEIIAHELGHIHEREQLNNASPEVKRELINAHDRWLRKNKPGTAEQWVKAMRAKTVGKMVLMSVPPGMPADRMTPYWRSFSEWYADQVSKWAVTQEAPITVVEKFFSRLGKSLRNFYNNIRNAGYLPDETFVKYMNSLRPVVNTDPDAGPVEIKEMTEEVKKLPKGRSPELAAAAQRLREGEISRDEYDEAVKKYKPIFPYKEPPKAATSAQVYDALDSGKKDKVDPQIPAGTKVGLRLDIPSFNRKGIHVVSIHEKRTPSAAGKAIGYGSVGRIKDVTFGLGRETKAMEIAEGAGKDVLETMEGTWVPSTTAEVVAEVDKNFKDPQWTQIGVDPERHSYFWDRFSLRPIIKADEVLQIGNFILAKNPVYGNKADFLFDIDPSPKLTVEQLREESREIRNKTISELAGISRRQRTLMKKVAAYGSDLETQRLLNTLEETAKDLKSFVNATKLPNITAEAFLKQARDAMEGTGVFRERSLDPEVFAVIQDIYYKAPNLLEGIRLSIKTPKEGARARGNFEPYARIVRLWNGTGGTSDPVTVRHEIMHSLELMMTVPQKIAVAEAWRKAFMKAIKNNPDKASQLYFSKVLEFLDNPTRETMDAATRVMPSYEYYQYINPSEFWAVNAEKLFKSYLGSPWDRFKKFVRKLFEGMKNVFGFNNMYPVHSVFDNLLATQPERMGENMLVDYVTINASKTNFLDNIEDDRKLVEQYNRPHTSMLDTTPTKTFILNAAKFSKDFFKDIVANPKEALGTAFGGIDYGITYLRNKNIWFGTGLNAADFRRYKGALTTGQDLATASVALDNAIRGGNIGVQVVFQGGIKFDSNSKNFVADKRSKGMVGVYEAEARLKEKLGAQLGTDIIQGYLEAKRSRSIQNEYYDREAYLEFITEAYEEMKADPSTDPKELKETALEVEEAKRDLANIRIVMDKIGMSDQEIDDFIDRENAHPELREIMDNWTAVNQNLLRFWRQVGLLSEKRYETLSNIKDYVPWYRIMNDDEDIHAPVQSTTRTFTNIGKEKLFKAGKPSNITDFIAEKNQQVYKITPADVLKVTVNGKKVKPENMSVTPDGQVQLNTEINQGDVVIFYTTREIENIIDNMTRNVMRMTMNGLRQYASSRIVGEYATRNEKDKIITFPKADLDKGRFGFIVDGRRVNVEIKDPLIAESVTGMETIGIEMIKPLAMVANFTRRTITASPVFQLKQVFKDAPTAAWVTGVRRPDLLMGGVFKGLATSLTKSDPAYDILRAAGIGGFYSTARTPEAEVKRKIGVINKNTFDYVMGALDHFGDSSDMAQRIATYKRVMAETGNEAQAIYQAANVINFMRHGSGQVAQFVTKTVPFMNAYAQSIDVLFQSLAGGGLKGKSRARALKQIAITGGLLMSMTLLYCFLVGDDEEYQKLDDQAKLRSYVIPGTKIVLPMNTSAAYFFKAIPEMIYNYVLKNGTENPMDRTRLATGLKEAAVDMLLGPNPVPSAVRPIVEIGLNKNFFTGSTVVPRGMENLEDAEQYNAATSEAGKILSAATGGEEKRLLSPVEADHLIRGIFGTAGAMGMWASNVIGQAAETRPAVTAKESPIVGPFLRPEVPRGPEDLFYDFKERTDKKYRTYMTLLERGKLDEAEKYLEKHEGLVAFAEYSNETDAALKEINQLIRMTGESADKTKSPKEKREEIENLQRVKNEILGNIEKIRELAGL